MNDQQTKNKERKIRGPAGQKKLMRDLALMKRRRLAFEMKVAGATYDAIAEQNGTSTKVAFDDVNSVAGEESARLEALRNRNRAMEDHGIQMLRRQLAPVIKNVYSCHESQDLSAMDRRKLQMVAINTWIKTGARRARLFGLDMQPSLEGGEAGTGGRPMRDLSNQELQDKIDTMAMALGVKVDVRLESATQSDEE